MTQKKRGGNMPKYDKSEMLGGNTSRAIAEQYQMLCGTLNVALSNSETKKGVFISGADGSLNSTIQAINLGISLVESGKKIVVVDANFRNNTLNKYYDSQNKGSLFGLVNDQLKYEDVVVKTETEGMDIVFAGAEDVVPSKLLDAKAVYDFFDYLIANYDLVICLIPIISNYSDAYSLSKHIGNVALVIEKNVTKMSAIEKSLSKIAYLELNCIGFIMINASAKAQKKHK